MQFVSLSGVKFRDVLAIKMEYGQTDLKRRQSGLYYVTKLNGGHVIGGSIRLLGSQLEEDYGRKLPMRISASVRAGELLIVEINGERRVLGFEILGVKLVRDASNVATNRELASV